MRASDMDYRRQFIEYLMEDMSADLTLYGFQRAPEQDILDGYGIEDRYWMHPRKWRTEYIRLHYPKGREPCEVILSRGLFINIENRGLEDSLLQSQSFLRQWLRSSVRWEFFAGRLRRRIWRKVIETLPWFEQFSTPEQCLAALTGGRTNWGDTRGPIVLGVEAKLRELIELRVGADDA